MGVVDDESVKMEGGCDFETIKSILDAWVSGRYFEKCCPPLTKAFQFHPELFF